MIYPHDRCILHCDCDSFFASVEETFNPEYRLVPMAVAGDPEHRHGIVVAKNQKAKAFGIRTAETIWSAKKKCPDLLLVPPRNHAYGEFCERVNAVYDGYTDQVERFGIDESFLDVTGSLYMFGGDPIELAKDIQRRISSEIGITVSVGISWNKIFAKLGSDQRKPNGIFAITRDNYKDAIWHLPVSDLFLVGRNTAEALRARCNVSTIGDLAQADESLLLQVLGKMGAQLLLHANGMDDSPVVRSGDEEEAKSIGNGMTFKRDLVTLEDIRKGVIALSDSVAWRLRKAGQKCATVQVTIKDTALKSIQRQKAPVRPTYLASELADTAMEIIQSNWRIGKPIRMITITAHRLILAGETAEQLSMFDKGVKDPSKAERLEKAIDSIRSRHGWHSVQSGAILRNDIGISDKD